MAISIQVTGNGLFQGSSTALTGYTVTEDATPIEGSDTTGGTGTLNFSVVENPAANGTIMLLNDSVQLTDGSNGITSGIVYSVADGDGIATISTNARTNAFVANVKVAPYTGTLGGAFTYYMSMVGITSGFVIDSTITTVRSNLFNNPSGRRTLTGYSVLNGSMGQDPLTDTYNIVANGSTAGNAGIALESPVVGGGKLLANTVYTFSAYVYSNFGAAALYVTGAGVGIGVSFPINPVTGFNRTSITFTTSASGVVNLYVLNNTLAPATGTNVISFRDAQLEAGTVATPYFDGSSIPSGDGTSSQWAGAIDNSVSTNARYVNYQGFTGSVWDFLKQMLIVQACEVSLVSNNIVLRPIRTRTLQMAKNSKVTRTTANSDLAQNVQAYYYNNTWKTNSVCYPSNGVSALVSAYQVDAGAVLIENISVSASLQSILQPTCVASTGITAIYSGSASIYTVAGQDGTPINPAVWTGHGGSITASIGQDQASIDIRIVGATGIGNAPYTIGVSNGASNYYAGLYIVGTGTFFAPVLVTVATGSPLTKAATTIGATVNNRFSATAAEAYSIALRTAQRWASPQQAISVSASVVNRPGDKGDVSYPTFALVDTSLSPNTFAQVDTLYLGNTFAQVNAIQQLLVVNNFENQAFGNIAGSRVLYQQAYYRVSTAQVTQDGITYSAVIDTIFDDVDSMWTGKTFAQFNTRWSSMTFQDAQVIPLWT